MKKKYKAKQANKIKPTNQTKTNNSWIFSFFFCKDETVHVPLDVPFSDVTKFSRGLAQGWLVQYSLQELLWLEHTLINMLNMAKCQTENGENCPQKTRHYHCD